MLVEQASAASQASAATATATATAGAAVGDAGDGEAEALVQKGLELVHGVYGACVRPCALRLTSYHPTNHTPNPITKTNKLKTADIYEAFHTRWLAADPPNVMSFPPIFDALKRDTRRRLRAARGDSALLAFLP